ncbi:MAG: hypothetical protein J6N78_00005, partial [Clostridia bacterium]|nr:hypothetical protein [Clostridia bacterium]
DGKISAANLKDALDGIVSQEEIDKITGNGPWIIAKENRKYFIKEDGTVKDYTKADKINLKIGETITYPTLGGATGWKIFYADSDEMFIIPSNIIDSSTAGCSNGIKLSTKTISEVMGKGTYGEKWNIAWLSIPGVVTNQEKHKAVTYLCDSENWETYVAKEGTTPKIAKSYAVGAPTLELFVASWNKAVSSSKTVSTPLATTIYGYYQAISSGKITTDEVKALYNPTGSGYYWIASPDHTSSNNMHVRIVYSDSGNGGVIGNAYNYAGIGFRPIVSIPISNVEVVEGTETVTINIKDDNGNLIQ